MPTTKMDQRALARQPTKFPSRIRFQGILDEAERLLLEDGLNGFSIPALAERLGYTRASIYNFFPTPHAVINELSQRYFRESSDLVRDFARAHSRLSWRPLLTQAIKFAADYYNGRPLARMLLLGGPLADQNYRIQEETNEQLGEIFRALFLERGIALPKEPDVAWIFIDIVDGVLRHSQYRYGRITDSCRDEAVRAAISYLAPYAEMSPSQRQRALKAKRQFS